MDEIKHQIVDRLKQANNILVTVRNNPNVDLLSACLGLSLVLDKMDKHAAAVFSGTIPSAIEFLKPETTIEQTPDSLRDFIIALDKSKADKLRYKVEDKVVRIFITPYKTSLSQDDLEFSQGDFNVDAVVALGVHEQQELDQAITIHGRILHDATVISINNTANGNLGSLNWQEIGASSISEMTTELVKDLHKDVFDEQIATALLTGIVAETERFSNDKTTPHTMSLAGELMEAGANQQLVASSLQAAAQRLEDQPQPMQNDSDPAHQGATATPSIAVSDDGTLEIDHEAGEEPEEPSFTQPSEPPVEESPIPAASPALPKIVSPSRTMLPTPGPTQRTSDYDESMQETPFTAEYEETPMPVRSYLIDRPTIPNAAPPIDSSSIEPGAANPLDVPPVELPAPILKREQPQPASASVAQLTEPKSVLSPPILVPPTATQPVAVSADDQPAGQTLVEIEESVHSPHIVTSPAQPTSRDVTSARGQVMEALRYDAPRLEPLRSLNANPLGEDLHAHTDPAASTPPTMGIEVDAEGNLKQSASQSSGHPATSTEPASAPLPPPAFSQSTVADPPPVPPPMTPPVYS